MHFKNDTKEKQALAAWMTGSMVTHLSAAGLGGRKSTLHPRWLRLRVRLKAGPPEGATSDSSLAQAELRLADPVIKFPLVANCPTYPLPPLLVTFWL